MIKPRFRRSHSRSTTHSAGSCPHLPILLVIFTPCRGRRASPFLIVSCRKQRKRRRCLCVRQGEAAWARHGYHHIPTPSNRIRSKFSARSRPAPKLEVRFWFCLDIHNSQALVAYTACKTCEVRLWKKTGRGAGGREQREPGISKPRSASQPSDQGLLSAITRLPNRTTWRPQRCSMRLLPHADLHPPLESANALTATRISNQMVSLRERLQNAPELLIHRAVMLY